MDFGEGNGSPGVGVGGAFWPSPHSNLLSHCVFLPEAMSLVPPCGSQAQSHCFFPPRDYSLRSQIPAVNSSGLEQRPWQTPGQSLIPALYWPCTVRVPRGHAFSFCLTGLLGEETQLCPMHLPRGPAPPVFSVNIICFLVASDTPDRSHPAEQVL